MGKIKLAHKKRKYAILLLSGLLALDLTCMIAFGIIGIKSSESVTAGAYSAQSEIQYAVTLLGNPLYNKDLVNLGPNYVTSLVDNINMTFLYNFSSPEAEHISSVADITASLEGIYNSENLLWSREYPMIAQKELQAGQDTLTLSLPLQTYRELEAAMELETGVKTSAVMTVTFTINTAALINGQTVSEKSVSTLVFDLSEDVLVLGGEPKSELTKTLTQEVMHDILPPGTVLYATAISSFLLAAALTGVLLITRGIRPDPVEAALGVIYKKHGTRIAEHHPGSQPAAYATTAVSSFRDLLLIADELKKPILKSAGTIPTETEFHVFDGVTKFIFRSAELMSPENKPAVRVK